MGWLGYTFLAIGVYLIVAVALILWYCLSMTPKTIRWLEIFCYPIGLIIALYALWRGGFRD